VTMRDWKYNCLLCGSVNICRDLPACHVYLIGLEQNSERVLQYPDELQCKLMHPGATSVCSQRYSNKQSMVKHQRKKEKLTQCSICALWHPETQTCTHSWCQRVKSNAWGSAYVAQWRSCQIFTPLRGNYDYESWRIFWKQLQRNPNGSDPLWVQLSSILI